MRKNKKTSFYGKFQIQKPGWSFKKSIKDMTAIGGFIEVIFSLITVSIGVAILVNSIITATMDLERDNKDSEEKCQLIARNLIADERLFTPDGKFIMPPIFNISIGNCEDYGVKGFRITVKEIDDGERMLALFDEGAHASANQSVYTYQKRVNLLYRDGSVGAGILTIQIW